MTLMPANFDALVGSYSGEGAWIDITGKSKRYRVQQSIQFKGDELTLAYAHDFFAEGSFTRGAFEFRRQGDCLCDVFMGGKAMGKGYMFGDYFHYFIKSGEIYVQASYQVTPVGLAVNGSSSSNSEGNFIAWHETLSRGLARTS